MTREELIYKYRTVFLSPIGLEVLGDILIGMCHFGQTLDNEHQMDEYNIGVGILAKIGAFSEGTRFDVLSAIASVTPAFKDKQVEPITYDTVIE